MLMLSSSICYEVFSHYSNRCIMSFDANGKNLGGHPPLNLTESQIRYAMANSWSNAGAARFLNVSYNTYTKYSQQYFDSQTGQSLFELHKNKPRPQKARAIKGDRRLYDNGYKEKLEDILAGLYPDYQPRPLRKRLFASGIIPMECSSCGWNECRVSDDNYPLYIAFRDGNWRNKRLENLYLLCFNCYFCQIGSLGARFQGISYGQKCRRNRLKREAKEAAKKENPNVSGTSG